MSAWSGHIRREYSRMLTGYRRTIMSATPSTGKHTMKTIRLALLGLTLHAMNAAAQDATQLMQQMAGVYRHPFMSASITPGKEPGEADVPYQAEDVIEIVPFDADHVYIRAHLDFYNGHTCDVSGMGRHEHGAFVYHDPEPPLEGYPPCALKVAVENGKLTLTDRATPDAVASCRAYCGVRGGWDYAIGMDRKRPIRYMDRLKNSRQYTHAIDDLHRTEPGTRRTAP
jgi:hypothetical protein